MKKIINAIKNYIDNYNIIQMEMIQSQGANYVNTLLFAQSLGMAIY